MQIKSIKNQQYTYKPVFKANLNCRSLKFQPKDFFVKIDGYGKDKNWAEKVITIADLAVDYLKKGFPIEPVLAFIASGVSNINKKTNGNYLKQFYSGKLRDFRPGWEVSATQLYTPYTIKPYISYAEKFKKIADNPLKNPYKDIDLSVINDMQEIEHGSAYAVNSAMDKIIEMSEELTSKYRNGNAKKENLEEINEKIAEIRWILAHSTMWVRGSDSISNIFMRSMYKSMGIKCYPLKSGVSLDLQAFCTELNDYKKNFVTYFDKEPVCVE